MNDLDKQTLNILINALEDTDIDAISDWPQVYKELKNQAVASIAYDLINKSKSLTGEELVAYQRFCDQSIVRNIRVLNVQKKMLEIFEENGIPVVILKGAAAAVYYPHPEYRTFGDIDIIVKPEHFDAAYKLLDEHFGCVQGLEENPRHAAFRKKTGVEIELHKYFSFGNRTEKKDLLDRLIYKGIDHREWKDILGYGFPCLPSIENGLVILNHIYQHLQGEGVGYRQLLDFRQFVQAEKEHMNEFLVAANPLGLSKLAEALIIVCRKYMKLDINVEIASISEETIEELMSLFMNSGNFGRKEELNGVRRSELIFMRAKNPLEMLKLLQKNGRAHWKASENHILLWPFAWIYQIGYYIKRIKIYGGVSAIQKGKKRRLSKEELFKELQL